jgi:hypothetical protein
MDPYKHGEHHMKALSEIRRGIAYLDGLLKPLAHRPIDINDLDWLAKMEGWDPLDQAGIKTQAQDLLSEILARYVEGPESDREELRLMFQEFGSFAWAATPREAPTSPSGLRAHLVLLSLQDQGTDPRDVLVAIDCLISAATKCGVDIQPLLAEVAEISSSRNRYGMGSMREIMRAKHSTGNRP